MPTYEQCVASLAHTLRDYKSESSVAMSPEHVARWAKQFNEKIRTPLVHEINYILKQTYISEQNIRDYLRRVITSTNLTQGDPKTFWLGTHILANQQNGQSQLDLLSIFRELRKEVLDVPSSYRPSNGNTYLYLDDALFSGNRILQDLRPWIKNDAPAQSTLLVVVCHSYTGGEWYVLNELKKCRDEAKKDISISVLREKTYENRKKYRDSSDVLWPSHHPESEAFAAYVKGERYPQELRTSTPNSCALFSSEKARNFVEQVMLVAGLHIRGLSANPSPMMRPLGFSRFGLGFGALTVTHRNCPNNAPLALWWGDPTKPASHPLSKWYPLLQRRVYDHILTPDNEP